MPGARPELLFVTGPQRDERAVLMRDIMIIGRGDKADLQLIEQFVSRKQLQFRRMAEGWIVECLSRSNPMRINGKRYKPGKQILLATGDVIAVGAETQMLFVDAMDDPHRVLTEWREANPDEVAKGAPVPVEPPEPGPESVPAPTASPAPARKEPLKEPSKAEIEKQKQKSRMRKYAIAFSAYLILLAVGAIILIQSKDKKGKTQDAAPARLSSEAIEAALTSDLDRSPNEVSAQRNLSEARNYFRHRKSERRNLYRCVLAYRLYKAYRRPEERVFLPEDERKYRIASRELVDKVREIYDRAWIAEMNGQWARAKQQYDLLLEYIPISIADEDPEVRDLVLKRIMAHTQYVSRRGRKK